MADSDAELMAQIAEGDRRAFGLLVDRYKHPIVGYLTRITGDPDQAGDLAQETFVHLFQAAQRYQERGQLSAWLYRVASNLAISQARRANRRRFLRRWLLPFSATPGIQPAAEPGPDTALQRSQLQRRVADAISNLPPRYRVPLVLHELEELGYAEVAAATGLAEGTVKSRVHRGRHLLKKKLADLAGEAGAWMTNSSAKS